MRYLKPLLFSCVSILTLFASSCTKNNPTQTVAANFLTDGHKLVYRILPNPYYPDTLYTVTYRKSSIQNVFIEADTSSNRFLTPGYETFERFDNGKLYYSDNANLILTSQNYSADFNAPANSYWIVYSQGFGSDTIRVLGKDVPTTVQAGTFNCGIFIAGRDTSYFSASVGEIKHRGVNVSYDLLSKNF